MNAMRNILAALLTSLLCVSVSFAQTNVVDPELIRLRHDWSMRYLEPGPHMELAKYFRAKGNEIQAFYILETARRYRFDQKEFDAAYIKHFGGFAPLDNSKSEEEKYTSLVKADPGNTKLLTHLADIYVSREDYEKAEPLFVSILAINPQDYSTVVALAEVYRRQERAEKATSILTSYETRYPESAGGYELRIQREFRSNKQSARQLVDEALKKFPSDGRFLYHRAWLSKQDGKLDDAEKHFVEAAKLAKTADYIQAGAAAFFRVERKDNARALPYYLNTYFLDPHAHFDGFAEAKVANLNSEIAKQQVDEWIRAGKKLDDLTGEQNPTVVAFALAKLTEQWDESKSRIFLKMLRHDDVLVRWNSMLTLISKEGIKLDTKIIDDLLKDEDLRVRGLAAYIAVRIRSDRSFVDIKALLREPAQVVRFDAISALLMFGGTTGKQLVKEHRNRESVKSLRDLIDTSLKD